MEESIKGLVASVAVLQDHVHSLSSLRELRSYSTPFVSRKHLLSEEASSQPRTKKAKLAFPPHPSRSSASDASYLPDFHATPRWAFLPEELLSTLLDAVPPAYVGMAARTCRSWWACARPHQRKRLAKGAVCSSMALLQWAVVENGCPLDRELCAAIAKEGQLELLRWARWNGCPWDRRTIHNAAGGGHLEVVRWARKNGCQWDENACAAAAKHGHLEVLKWLHAHGCPWKGNTTIGAAANGHLAILQWAFAQGCPCEWELVLSAAARRADKETLEWGLTHGGPCKEVCAAIAEVGNLELLRWARAEGFPWEPCMFGASVFTSAAPLGNLELLKWAHENGCPFQEERVGSFRTLPGLPILRWLNEVSSGELFPIQVLSRLIRSAAKQGKLEIVQWAVENGCPWTRWISASAASGGQLELIKWTRENGCPWDEETSAEAAGGGHLTLLKWLHENGCLLNEKTCSSAARNGHLEVLQWARSQGCPWNANTTKNAASNGHLELLVWAVTNGCRWDSCCCDLAARGGHIAVIQWALGNGIAWIPDWLSKDPETVQVCNEEAAMQLLRLTRKAGHPWTANMFVFAAAGNHLNTLKWLRKKGCPWDASACSAAAAGGHLEALQWLHAHACPWSAETFKRAVYNEELAVVQWLVTNGCPVIRLTGLVPCLAMKQFLAKLNLCRPT